ncbi:hypothetical protein H2200_013164 [Cladophialophora chaetospira]|uniref:Uncharacterized protein n=1 Tax=Cladophialophora chaetospira TaxID=386627 RepID=A0AA38WWA7_9EURO|nr:hypothetical protein H2200_013164 [Cladophialophora chaetospira]
MPSRKVVFVEEDPARALSSRDKNLRFSVVRSQAARHSHKKRTKRIQAGYQASVDTPPVLPTHDQIYGALIPVAIGQGRTDPFDAQALNSLHPIITLAVDRLFNFILPELILASPLVRNRIMVERRQDSNQHAFMYHADVSHALSVWLNRNPEAESSLRRTVASVSSAHKVKALEGMIRCKDQVSLDLIMSGITAYGGQANHSQAIDLDVFPKTPLARTQVLNIWANMRLPWGYDDTQKAIFGDKVPLLRLKDQLAIDMVLTGHLSEVAQHDISPQYPWPYYDLEPKLREAYVSDEKGDLGTGFDAETTSEDFRKVIDLLTNTTVDLNAFHNNHPGAPAEWELALRRNFAHYQLYLLPRVGDAYHLTCRLAFLIYSDFIFFPIAFPEIRLRICFQLQAILQHGYVHPDQDFNVWVLVMGAVASIDTPFQDWYVSMLSIYLTLYAIGDWTMLKRAVMKFLWWDHVLDPRLFYLWHEAKALASVDEIT